VFSRRNTGNTDIMEGLFNDIAYGTRTLRKHPGFTAIAVLTLALGIGANTAIFSVVNAVLLNPLPYSEPQRLVALGQTSPENPGTRGNVSYPNFLDWKTRSRVFDGIAAYYNTNLTMTGGEKAVRLRGAVVTHNLFNLLGVSPIHGRSFQPEDDKAGGGSDGLTVLLSWESWQQYFGGEAKVVGQTITLNERKYTVIGVMPSRFEFPVQAASTEAWVSTARDAEVKGLGTIMEGRGYRTWKTLARLKSNVTLAEAQAEMDTIAANLAAAYPQINTNVGVKVMPLLESIVGRIRPMLQLLFGAVAFVLLIACLNVANLLIEHAIKRQREITVRVALGASRWRVTRQLLIESLLLSLAGGALGTVLAFWMTRLLVEFSPDRITRVTEARLNGRVLLFTLLASVLTGIVFGLAPALSASRVNLTESLKEGGRGSAGGFKLNRLRHGMVVVQVALAIMLLAGAGLLVQSLLRLQRVDPGLNTENVLTFSTSLPGSKYPHQRSIDFYRTLVDGIKQLPGVTAASAVYSLPLSGEAPTTGFDIEGRPTDPGHMPIGEIQAVTPGYFRTMGIPLVSGRDFDDRDTLRSALCVIVNEALAKKYFPGENPIGKRIDPSFSMTGGESMREIVGVIANVKHRNLQTEAQPAIYFAHAQMPMAGMSIVVRTTQNPSQLVGAVRAQVQALDSEIPIYRVRTLDEYVSLSIAEPRFNTLLIGLFAFLALLLTVVGIYGVVSYTVTQSVRELGIRIALGAQSRDILKLVVGRLMLLTGLGIILGLAGSAALKRFIATMLYEVSASNPAVYVGVSALLLLVALLACYLPARRATRVDPLVALRYE
jgi:putative ABC transport system permease protein